MLELIEARYYAPDNSRPGLCVQLRGTREEVISDNALSMAEDVAEEEGWNPDGKGNAGLPSRYNSRLCDRFFWFYERLTTEQAQ